MKIALRTCWVNALSARRDRLHQWEPTVAVHLDHPDRLLDVVLAGELEGAQRRVDADRLHRVAELRAVTGGVAEREVRSLGGVRQDQNRRVALGGELVGIAAVLALVGADKPSVRRERIVDVPGTAALSTLAVGCGRLRHGRRVEAVTAQKLPGKPLLARLPHDVGRNVAQAGDADDVGVLLHRLRYEWREIGRRFGERDRGQQLDAVLANRAGDDGSTVL